MIPSEHKPIGKKDIYEVKFNNHERQLSAYSPFHKTFHKKLSLKKNSNLNNKNNNIHLISLLRNQIFLKSNNKLFDFQTNYNSYNSYVTKMMVNAAKLIKYDHTKYIPSKNKIGTIASTNKISNLKQKNFLSLSHKLSKNYEENSSAKKNTNDIKYISKSPSSLDYNGEKIFTFEDDILANKIYNETYRANKESIDKKEIDNFFEKHSIEKDISYDEKKKIKKIMSHSNFMNKKNCLISPLEINDFNDFSNNNEIFTKTNSISKDYENPYHSLERLKINSKIQETVGKIRNNLQYQKFEKQFNFFCDLKISKNRMPNIKTLNKQSSIKKRELLKNKNVVNYFKQHKNNLLNKKKLKDNIIKNYEKNNNEEETDEMPIEEKMKKIQIDIWHLESGYHPESRLMSSICFDFEENILYFFGGQGGIIYGDLWECKFEENKIAWERIYNYNCEKNKENNYLANNMPLPRFGHTIHYYKKKIFLVGGEFKDWKRDIPYEEILWIFDIEKREWISLHKFEIKNILIYDKRKNSYLFKIKKNFSDMLLKIPLLISPNLNPSKSSKKKNLNKTLFTKKWKEEEKEKTYKKLRPCLRRNHVSLLIGSHILIYGGISQDKEILNDCWIYDLKLYKWAIIKSIGKHPPALGHHCSCLAIEKDQLVNDTFNIYHKPKNSRGTVDLLKIDGVFFFGGISSNKIPTNLLFHMTIGIKPAIFDIPDIDGRPPKPRIDASMDFAQNISMIIIYGGKNELDIPSYYGDMTLLDLRIMNWIQPVFMKEKPIKRAQHLSIVIGEELIIFGGTTGNKLLNYDFTIVDLNLFNK